MATKVIDASAAVALLFNEPEADEVDRRLAGAALVAPALFSFEITDVCLTKLRQLPTQRDLVLEQFFARSALAIEIQEVDHAEVLALAESAGLTAYDASYLWLARRFGVELVTLDQRLARAAAAS